MASEEPDINRKQTYPAQASGSNVKHIRSTYGARLIRVMVVYKHGAPMEQKQEKHRLFKGHFKTKNITKMNKLREGRNSSVRARVYRKIE